MEFFPLFISATTSVERNFLPTVSKIPFKTNTFLSLPPAWIKEHAWYVSLHRLTFAWGGISSEKGTAFLLPALLGFWFYHKIINNYILLPNTDFFLAILCCWLFISRVKLEIAQMPNYFCLFKFFKETSIYKICLFKLSMFFWFTSNSAVFSEHSTLRASTIFLSCSKWPSICFTFLFTLAVSEAPFCLSLDFFVLPLGPIETNYKNTKNVKTTNSTILICNLKTTRDVQYLLFTIKI